MRERNRRLLLDFFLDIPVKERLRVQHGAGVSQVKLDAVTPRNACGTPWGWILFAGSNSLIST